MNLIKYAVAHRVLFLMILSLSVFLVVPEASAVYPPEPQSGGRFFHAKGTKSAQEYRYLGRTGIDTYEDYYYGDGLQVDRLRLRPYVSYTGEWDTNVFLSDDDAKDDYISRLDWGMDGEVPFEDGKYILYGGVHSQSEWFATFDEENHTDWIYQGGLEFNFTHFRLEVFEEFRKTVDRSDSELTRRIERKENYLTGLLTIPFGQFFQETEVSHYLVVFEDSAFDVFDRREFRVVPRIGVDVGDRTQALLEYDITNINYDANEDRNGDAHQWAAGVRGFLGEGDLISYQAWAGWQIRNYDSDMRDDFNGFIFRADAEYRPSEVSRIFLEASRRPVESVTSSTSFIVRHDIAARWRRQLTERLGGEVRGSVGFYDYSNDRLDFYWEPRVRLDYQIVKNENISSILYGEYRFSQRASDAANEDYLRHLLSFGLRFEA